MPRLEKTTVLEPAVWETVKPSGAVLPKINGVGVLSTPGPSNQYSDEH